MNIKKAARQLEHFYEEVKGAMQLTVLPNSAVGYKDYIVRPMKDGTWELVKKYNKGIHVIDVFNLKTCAIISAKYHETNSLQYLIDTKNMDNLYWTNHTDSVYFKHFYVKTQDPVRKDNFLWRHEITTQRAVFYKEKISATFRTVFR
jgi:hypothetical protein